MHNLCDTTTNSIFFFFKHAKVDDAGLKSKPEELSQDDIEAAKKEWENIILSEGEDDM